ncbi:MAG: AN1-type zinc finger protein [Nitrosotalea sp.]
MRNFIKYLDVLYLLVKSVNNQLYFNGLCSKITEKYCTFDGAKVEGTLSMPCKLCGYVYCKDHLSPQRHKCVMLENVEYVKADAFSNSIGSQAPNELHMPSSTDNTSIHVEPSVEKVTSVIPSMDNPYWLSDCLEDAKNLIVEYHDEKPDDKNFVDCANFFAHKTFDAKIQNNGNASGDINLIRGLRSQPSYKICIHDILREDTRDNRRMVTVVLVHQLLHAIHPSRMHDFVNGQKGINKLEHEVANRASYHYAILNLESLNQSGKIHPCNM